MRWRRGCYGVARRTLRPRGSALAFRYRFFSLGLCWRRSPSVGSRQSRCLPSPPALNTLRRCQRNLLAGMGWKNFLHTQGIFLSLSSCFKAPAADPYENTGTVRQVLPVPVCRRGSSGAGRDGRGAAGPFGVQLAQCHTTPCPRTTQFFAAADGQ